MNHILENREIIIPEHIQMLIDKYKDEAIKIVYTASKRLHIYMQDKTLCFAGNGESDIELNKDLSITPLDYICYAKSDLDFSQNQYELMLGVCKQNNVDKYIKRVGDSSLIVPIDSKCIAINSKGWTIPYNCNAIYKPDELFTLNTENNVNKTKDIKIENISDNSVTGKEYKGDNINRLPVNLSLGYYKTEKYTLHNITKQDIESINPKEVENFIAYKSNQISWFAEDSQIVNQVTGVDKDKISTDEDTISGIKKEAQVSSQMFMAEECLEDYTDATNDVKDDVKKETVKSDISTNVNDLNLGMTVIAKYNNETITGIITRIYNNGETVNVTWDDKCTSFYYMNVEKIS